MRQQIVDLINERGEMTFRELCCELNMFSRAEVEEMEGHVYALNSGLDECPDCKGEGTLECGECDGDGHWTCDSCDGSGNAECLECGGSGLVTIKGNEEPCDECDETGLVDCDECENGIVYCENCDDGKFECDLCDGHGESTTDEGIQLVIVGPQSLIGSSVIQRNPLGVH